MTDEEKIELIDALHLANHQILDERVEMINSIAGLASAMHVISTQVLAGNKFGQRTKQMNLAAIKLEVLSQLGFAEIGVTYADVEQAEKFGDIIADLENDPSLQFPEEGAGLEES